MRRVVLLLVALVLLSMLGGCGPYGDGAAAMRAHRREAERRADDMRAATRQTTRGTDLVGDALIAALSGRTIVTRYASFPDKRAGKYVVYRYYRPDGRFVWVDNWIHPVADEASEDYWKVDGARLCVLHRSYSATEGCFRVARTREGALQFFIDDPGEQFDGLLTIVATEMLDGAPPAISPEPSRP